MISADDDADEERGAPAVHQPHHLVAAEAAVGAEEELAAGAEPDRADRLAFGVDDVALFAVDGDLFQRVGRRSGPVSATWFAQSGAARTKTTIRTKRPRKASATRLRRSRRRARRQGLRLGAAPPRRGRRLGLGSAATLLSVTAGRLAPT